MKRQIIIVGITLVLIIVVFSGCTQQDSSYDTLSSDQLKSQTIPKVTESIHTILAKTETIESMYYEIAAYINMSEFGTQAVTIKIWQKRPFFKEQITSFSDGVTAIISVIHRPEGTYIYDTEQGIYILTTDVTSLSTSLQYFDSGLIIKYLDNQTLTNFDTEIIDGKKATVIQYTPFQEENLITIKMWIWNERGVPLKAFIDMTMEDITMEMDFKFSNYSFSDIPDSTFSIS
jgi:outer membrane lipoprotein-sorting protein